MTSLAIAQDSFYSGFLVLTYACNQGCAFCYAKQGVEEAATTIEETFAESVPKASTPHRSLTPPQQQVVAIRLCNQGLAIILKRYVMDR